MPTNFLRSVAVLLPLIVALSFLGSNQIAASKAVAQSSGCEISEEFTVDGVLPSSLGFTYTSGLAPFPETSVASVAGGVLHISTFGHPVTDFLSYDSTAYDPSQGWVLEFRMKVSPGTNPFGIDFAVTSAARQFEVGFTTNAVILSDGAGQTFLPFDPTDAFHTYKAVSSGGATYDFFIDGQLVFASTVTAAGVDPPRVRFGDLTGGASGEADIDYIHFCQSKTVPIDIKPGSFPNSINPRSNGVIPVAILTTLSLDAADVDPSTVRFGITGTQASPVHSAMEDVDGDGDTDRILHFRTQSTGITCGATSASLTGKTFNGQTIKGTDSVRTVGCN